MKKPIEKSILRKTFPFLKIISELPLKDRKRILRKTNGDQSLHKSLRELSHNYLKGNIKTIKKPKKSDYLLMRALADKKNKTCKCSCKKRSHHLQKGAGLISLLIPAVASLMTSLINKK